MRRLEEFRPEAATVTLGDRGSMTSSDGELFHQPAFDVDVVDTTGAGDVFHGGYIYGLLQGVGDKEDGEVCLRLCRTQMPGGWGEGRHPRPSGDHAGYEGSDWSRYR